MSLPLALKLLLTLKRASHLESIQHSGLMLCIIDTQHLVLARSAVQVSGNTGNSRSSNEPSPWWAIYNPANSLK